MKLKVKYEVVAKEGEKPEKKTTEIFVGGALMPEDITEMIVKKHPDAHSVEVKNVTESLPRKTKPAASSKPAGKPDDDDEPDGEVSEADDEISDDELPEDDDGGPQLQMAFRIDPDGCKVVAESMGEVVMDGEILFEQEQDPLEVGAGLIAAVQGFLDELAE